MNVLPPPKVMRRADVVERLKKGLFNDAVSAGWLKAVCCKKGARRDHSAVYFSTADVIDIEAKILAGKYPGQAAA